jgi:hypothetical protein
MDARPRAGRGVIIAWGALAALCLLSIYLLGGCGGGGASYAGPISAGQRGWAVALLKGAGLPAPAASVDAVEVWERAEGGGFGNQATWNPLNLNPCSGRVCPDWPGHPADGAWAFPDERDGLDETIDYLHYPNFAAIYAAFAHQESEHQILAAIVSSPWAGSHYAGNLVMAQALAQTSAIAPRARLGLAA